MSRIVVTGGAGYVGLPLCRRLAGKGHDVIVVDDGSCGDARADAVRAFATLHKVDITDPSGSKALVEADPEMVVHLAALHFIPECNRRPVDAARINVLGTQAVLDACSRLSRLSKIVVTSSAAVYPVSDRYFTEADPPAPTDIYGITKAVNERQAFDFSRHASVPTAVVRLFNVFGPGETNPHLIPEIFDQLRRGARRVDIGNSAPKRCYVYIDDVVEAYEAILAATLPRPFAILNVGQREEASAQELLDMIASILGEPVTAQVDPTRLRATDRAHLRCNPDLAYRIAGWKARHSIAAGLRKLVAEELRP